MQIPTELIAYIEAGKPLVCDLPINPFICEFWPLKELATFNVEYEVPIYAPGYFGFATSGGGEMFAFSPTNSIVCLPFIGMSPKEATPIAQNWKEFEGLLKNAL